MELYESLYCKQLKNEQEALELGRTRYRGLVDKAKAAGTTHNLLPEVRLIEDSIPAITKRIKEAFECESQLTWGSNPDHSCWTTLINKVPAEDLALLTLRHLIGRLPIVGADSLQNIGVKLGRVIVNHINFKRFQAEHPGYFKRVTDSLNKTKHEHHRKRTWLKAQQKVSFQKVEYSERTLLRVGCKLIYWTVESTGLWFVDNVWKKTKRFKTVTPSPELYKYLEEGHSKCENLHPVLMPMVVPPVDWSPNKLTGGGFLNSNISPFKISMVRTWNRNVKEGCLQGDLRKPVEVLNTLQRTPWRINKKILSVFKVCISEGKGLGGTPFSNLEDQLIPKPWQTTEEYKALGEDFIQQWKCKQASVYDKWHRETSKRSTVLFQQWIADRFKDEEAIYFCWNFDWRGRIYPIQPLLHPQSDDAGKALLEFAKAKPLGPHGAKWLAIDGANNFGVDKVSYADRVEWVKEHEREIVDSAENPLDGLRFWTKADSPLKFLAFCFEWAELVSRRSQGLPDDTYLSRHPCAWDGSCNGLQNFSALLKDNIGGASVNLLPGEKPSDIYQEVAKETTELLKAETKETDKANLWIEIGITRSLVKRNVMTLPYGATHAGFTDQLQQYCRKEGIILPNDFKYCKYLATVTKKAMANIVVKSVEAMDWLKDVANILCKETNREISWTTPAGFKVTQDYRKSKRVFVVTLWGTFKYRLSLQLFEDLSLPIAIPKMKAAISPNFIHSLDASHLMLTVLKAKETADITDFAMIHDSYGTHAGKSEDLQRILREVFVEMYSRENLLKKFKREVEESCEGAVELPEPPEAGTLELQTVTTSPYFFS